MATSTFGLVEDNPTAHNLAVVGSALNRCLECLEIKNHSVQSLKRNFGVYFFAFGYPIFETLYKSGDMGSLKISTIFGLGDGIFALILVVVALGMFYVSEWVEKKFPREEY